jgi:thymidylate kinase
MLITFSGIDCAGKSTQIELLDTELRQGGQRVRTFWYRPGYSPQLDKLRALVRRTSPQLLPTSNSPQERKEIFSRSGVSVSWVAMALADMLIQYGAKLRAMMALSDVVICDRYIFDAVIDFQLRFPDFAIGRQNWFDSFRKLLPQPDISFLLVISEIEMIRRMELKNEPFPDSAETRDNRFNAYMELRQRCDIVVVDADQPAEDVHGRIISQVV